MTENTYAAHGIVLAKTPFGESNLIIRMLAEDGSLLEVVAHGARNPKNAISARLMLFNEVEVLLAKGKSLDVVIETRLTASHRVLHIDPAYEAAASTVAEFAAKTAQPGLEAPKFFDLTKRSLEAIADSATEQLCMIAAANLLKASAKAGSRPNLSECVICGEAWHADGEVACISLVEGGVVCNSCKAFCDGEHIPSELIAWTQYILMTRFDELLNVKEDQSLGIDLIQLADRWIIAQYGFRLKSIAPLIRYCAI